MTNHMVYRVSGHKPSSGCSESAVPTDFLCFLDFFSSGSAFQAARKAAIGNQGKARGHMWASHQSSPSPSGAVSTDHKMGVLTSPMTTLLVGVEG